MLDYISGYITGNSIPHYMGSNISKLPNFALVVLVIFGKLIRIGLDQFYCHAFNISWSYITQYITITTKLCFDLNTLPLLKVIPNFLGYIARDSYHGTRDSTTPHPLIQPLRTLRSQKIVEFSCPFIDMLYQVTYFELCCI